MKSRCVIITALYDGELNNIKDRLKDNDYIICADAGYELADSAGITPDVIIGDFDSSSRPEGDNILVFPVIKDDTDTMLCVKHGLEKGFSDFLILGGIGGRLDHTIANIQTLLYLKNKGASAKIDDGREILRVISNESIDIEKTCGKLSVFAVGGSCEGVTIKGTKYETDSITITPDFPIGMGNDFTEDRATIEVKTGNLLIINEYNL